MDKTVKFGFKNYKEKISSSIICQIIGEIAILLRILNPLLTQLIFDGVINYSEGDNVLVSPFYKFLTSGFFGDYGTLKLFISIALFFLGNIIVKTILIFIRNVKVRKNGLFLENNLRWPTYNKLLKLSDKSLNKYSTGDILTVLDSDVVSFKEIYATIYMSMIDAIFIILLSCIFLSTYNIYLILIPLVTMPAYFFVVKRYKRLSKELSTNIRQKNADMNFFVQEHVNGIRLVKSYANEELTKKQFDEKNKACYKGFENQIKTQAKYGIFFSAVMQITYISTVFICAAFVLRGDMQVGVLVVAASYVMQIMVSINEINSYLFMIEQDKVCGGKVMELLDSEEIADTKKYEPIKNYNISIKNLSFYNNGKQVLNGLNLGIPYGMKLGIMGETGSGKSVLLKCLSNIIEDYTGTITLGEKNIKEYSQEELRGQFSYVFQDVFLFSDTIDSNIAFSKPDAKFEEILDAAKTAKAHGFISDIKTGYNTIVGEKGIGLSGGQKQRISVARALIKNAPILVLDDATSALDKTTEKELLETLKSKYPQKTLIISAHKVSSIKDCDKIIYIENGNIIEQGSFEELMAYNGVFANVVRMQEENN